MKLTILGCYSATPRAFTNPTAQILDIKGNLFLIDCGEGTQVQLRKFKIKFSRIKHVFISHLHGDHFYGLIGLISTFRLLGREAELHIYGPKGIKEVTLLQLKLGNSYGGYNLIFHELDSKTTELIYEDDKVTVHTIPLNHRVYTNGFLFKEKIGERKLNIDAVLNNDIELCDYRNIKMGKDVENKQGKLIPNSLVSFAPDAPKSYAFCSDTKYTESIIPIIKDVSVLYHESTFLNEHEHLCNKTKHSTATQAATIARKANAKQLILGHFSTRYNNIDYFKKEAKIVFENVLLADDGKEFNF
ncbi:MAG: ribonuclease Z [Flavobacteriaceae bacterium]